MNASEFDALIEENRRLRVAVRQARIDLAAAYGEILDDEPVVTVAPLETPPAAWAAARDEQEQRLGVRLWKFFRRIHYAPA